MSWKALTVCGLALVLSACTLGGARAGQASPNAGWAVTTSPNGAIEVAHPGQWRLLESGDGMLSFQWEKGCVLDLRLAVASRPAGESQSEVLDGMLEEAQDRYEATGGEVEAMGREVWLGQNFIWHELHYVARAGKDCPECRSGYTIELLALPNEAESLRATFVCPGSDPPDEATQQLLTDVINTVVLVSSGAT
ncbi:MAG: hypothetical protein ACOYEW_14080 [Anaerolineae bacterium]